MSQRQREMDGIGFRAWDATNRVSACLVDMALTGVKVVGFRGRGMEGSPCKCCM